MRIKNNVMVIDTETVGTFADPLVHDIGYVILDTNLNPILEKRFLVSELHHVMPWILNTSNFYTSKANKYDLKNEANERLVRSWREISNEIIKDGNAYNVNTIAAYNIAFDYLAIYKTDSFYSADCRKLLLWIDKRNLLCLWNLACETVFQTKSFYRFAAVHGAISKSENFKTDAETCYRFLANKVDFQEEHTALEDAKIESQILKVIVTNFHKKISYGKKYQCWRKV